MDKERSAEPRTREHWGSEKAAAEGDAPAAEEAPAEVPTLKETGGTAAMWGVERPAEATTGAPAAPPVAGAVEAGRQAVAGAADAGRQAVSGAAEASRQAVTGAAGAAGAAVSGAVAGVRETASTATEKVAQTRDAVAARVESARAQVADTAGSVTTQLAERTAETVTTARNTSERLVGTAGMKAVGTLQRLQDRPPLLLGAAFVLGVILGRLV